MSFTRQQAMPAIKRIVVDLKAQGVRDIPLTKDDLIAVGQALKATIDSNQYRNSQSNAIDQAVPSYTFTVSEKKALHRAFLQAMLDEDLI